MPRRLVCVGKEELEWQGYDEPALNAHEVRVRAQFAAAKHGTEMAFFKGYAGARGVYDPEYQIFRHEVEQGGLYPFHVGNMMVGEVEAVGPDVSRVDVGDRVCAYSSFGETSVVNENACWKMPPGMSWKSAVCLDPADFALGAIRDGHVRVGDAVAVFGLGAIGLMVVQFAKLAGAHPVIGVDPLSNRRGVAEALGVDLTLDPTACDAGLEIKRATEARGVDVAIDYSGAKEAVQQALRGVAYGGNVVLGSFPAPYGPGLDLGAESHINVPNVIFTRACSEPHREYPRWDNDRIYAVCWRLLCEGAITGEPIVQPVVPFDELLEEYPRVAAHAEAGVKLGVRY
ncbi:MAG: zinc-binding alcohol dehydrogenase [Chloroflexota bacterium]|nr:zinc-binding alcohol dehydrogenase [Chloroflexota bacterium]